MLAPLVHSFLLRRLREASPCDFFAVSDRSPEVEHTHSLIYYEPVVYEPLLRRRLAIFGSSTFIHSTFQITCQLGLGINDVPNPSAKGRRKHQLQSLV